VWSLSTGLLDGSMTMGVEASALSTSPIAPIALIGTTSGYLFVVDLTDHKKGRIVHRTRAYTQPISRIT